MELTVTVLGMILAFLAGAYVRQPFSLRQHEVKVESNTKPIELNPEQEKAQERYNEQMRALWAYSEREALNGTQED